MGISKEQIEELKKQVIQQIESTFPEDKKDSAINQIKSMENEEFIEFLKKNNLINTSEGGEEGNVWEGNNKDTPFRLIIEGKTPSYKIDENKDSIAVLEINPISKAHIILIPKKTVKKTGEIPKSLFALAEKISKKIKTKFKPKEVLISSSIILGEAIVNLLPIYNEESLNSPRQQISKEELEELKNVLEKKQKIKTIKEPKITKIEESKMWLPKRIP
ncbi:MAG: HIT domain-containing protein [Candidatus Diapherotrites archaeon]